MLDSTFECLKQVNEEEYAVLEWAIGSPGGTVAVELGEGVVLLGVVECELRRRGQQEGGRRRRRRDTHIVGKATPEAEMVVGVKGDVFCAPGAIAEISLLEGKARASPGGMCRVRLVKEVTRRAEGIGVAERPCSFAHMRVNVGGLAFEGVPRTDITPSLLRGLDGGSGRGEVAGGRGSGNGRGAAFDGSVPRKRGVIGPFPEADRSMKLMLVVAVVGKASIRGDREVGGSSGGAT
jgi:hypothetical protein